MTLAEATAFLPRYFKLGLNVKLTGIPKISGRPEIRNYLTVEQIKADGLENADLEYYVSAGVGDYHSIEQQHAYFRDGDPSRIVALLAQFDPGFPQANYYAALFNTIYRDQKLAEAVKAFLKSL